MQITKKDFLKYGEQGLYYLGSAFKTLGQVKAIIDAAELTESYPTRHLQNRTLTSLQFKTERGTNAYLDISGKNVNVHLFNNIIYVETVYENGNNTVVYKLMED